MDGLRWEWVKARRIVFCFDRDEAGKKWQELAWQGVQQGREICFLTAEAYAGHKDLNEIWVAMGKIEIGEWEGRRRTPLPRWVDNELAPGPSPSPALGSGGKTGGDLIGVLGPETSILTPDLRFSLAGVSPKIRELTGEGPVGGPSGPAPKLVSAVATRESLQRGDPSSFWMKADGTCSRCAGRLSWRSIHGMMTCATCHPPANLELVAEWIE